MKKKTLSVVLSFVLLFSCALLPVSATAFVDLDDPEVTWSDSSCLRLMAPVHANNPINLPLGTTISENCTVTWYLKPDVSDVLQTFNFYLSSTYLDGNINDTDAANSWLTGISFGRETGGLKAIPYCNKFFFNLQGLGGPYCGYGNTLDEPNLYWYESGVTHADVSMTAGEWNRIDLSVDMENRVTDVYLNYKKIGSGKFFSGELAEFNALYIPYPSIGNVRYCNMDNLLIRKGCHAPAKGDLGSNLGAQSVQAEKDQILYFDAFDLNNRTIGKDVNVSDAGAVICSRQGEDGYANEIITTDGIAKQNGVMFRGVQVSNDPGTVFNARFVATLDSLDYESAGFDISVDGKTATEVFCHTVYDSILGSDTTGITLTYSALGSFGANYIYCLTVKDIAAGQSFVVTPFTYRDGVKISGVGYQVTFEKGVPTITAA